MEEDYNVPLSRAQLESLSTGELIRLAESSGIDILQGLERIFIIEELLEYSHTNVQEIKDDLKNDPCSETADLPKQYNISYVDVIIRDPLWVYVFWEIKGSDRAIHENADDFKGYCLRIVPLNEEETEQKSGEYSFTVPVNAEDCARYFGFTEHSHGRYKIKLGVIRGDSEVHIASSASFCLPAMIDNENIHSMKENPLIRLSGVQDLSIIKNTDRHSRIKRQ
ncbi:MAG: DUF4912 domain-containing protein [Treponema sp.]|jgi:hypothetical protein|nr:DUF4912 domain-containing protein [Treponema sp.]